MGLSPRVFWSLTVREFWIKHAAWKRADDRERSRVYLLASLIGHFKEQDLNKVRQTEMALRRYPLKKWLLPDGESLGSD